LEHRDDICVRLRSSPCLLKTVRELVRQYMDVCGVSAERRDEAVLAVDEACANAIRHSYGGCETEVIELAFRKRDDCVEIVLRDHGAPADLARVERKRSGVDRNEKLKPGGLGVALICRVFDEVDYRPGKNAGNRVTMRLRLPGALEGQAAARTEQG